MRFYLTLVITIFTLFSFYLSAAKSVESFSSEAVTDYYLTIYEKFKEEFISYIGNIEVGRGEPITDEAAVAILLNAIYQIPSLIAIFAFALTGITVKLFSFISVKICKHGILNSFLYFLPTNIVAYSYVILVILNIFSGTGSEYSLIVSNLCSIFMIVFAYVGLKQAYYIALSYRKKVLFIVIAIMAIILFSSLTVSLLSYFGVFSVITINKGISGGNVKED